MKYNFILFLYFILVNAYPQTWEQVVSWGDNNAVYSLFKNNNELYVGGNFTQINNNSNIKGIARYDGSQWYSFGTSGYSWVPIDYAVYSNELIIGGCFSNFLGSYYAENLASWDGTNWDRLGNDNPTHNTTVRALAVYQNCLYAGGTFTTIGTTTYQHIARWDGSQWHDLDGGIPGGVPSPGPYSMVVYKGELIVGGRFGGSYTVNSSNIIRWDGTQWKPMGTGLDGHVFDMVVDMVSDMLYVCGVFYNANDTIPCKFVARWDGANWFPLGNQTDNYHGINPGVTSLKIYNNRLFAGGWSSANDGSDTVLASWNGYQWQHFLDPNGGIEALEVYNDKLYAGGYFNGIGNDTSIKYIASYYDTIQGNLGVAINKTKPQNEWYLGNNIPNPFKNTTAIPYRIPPGESGEIKVFGYNGDLIKGFPINAGNDTLEITTTGWQQGTYLYSLYIKGELKETKKMVVR